MYKSCYKYFHLCSKGTYLLTIFCYAYSLMHSQRSKQLCSNLAIWIVSIDAKRYQFYVIARPVNLREIPLTVHRKSSFSKHAQGSLFICDGANVGPWILQLQVDKEEVVTPDVVHAIHSKWFIPCKVRESKKKTSSGKVFCNIQPTRMDRVWDEPRVPPC